MPVREGADSHAAKVQKFSDGRNIGGRWEVNGNICKTVYILTNAVKKE